MKSLLLSLLLFLSGSILSQMNAVYLPSISDSSQYIDHTYYCLEYDENHEQAKWTYYLLTKRMTNAKVERGDNFRPDPLVLSGSASNEDYKGSGYDRGHLVPAGDMAFSEESMSASFYYSNMSPQVPSFNRGIWKKLETLVRYWAFKYDSLYVVSGPIYGDSTKTIGPNHVGVPSAYFKAVYCQSGKRSQMIGFVLPNEASNLSLTKFVVNIDTIESITSIDLYASLPESFQNSLEQNTSTKQWVWKPGKIEHKSEGEVTQCTGTTKSGKRCKRMTSDSSGFCYQHK